jgi:hypothetical protein
VLGNNAYRENVFFPMTSVGKVPVAMGCENEACKLELEGHMIAGSYTMLRKEAQMEFLE